MDKRELQDRTKKFALRVIRMSSSLAKNVVGRTISGQIVRSATSVAANYRAACRGRSRAEFASKLGIVLEEADESQFWLEIILEGELLPSARLSGLIREAAELTAIFTSASRTLNFRGPKILH